MGRPGSAHGELRIALFPPAPAEPDAYLNLLSRALRVANVEMVRAPLSLELAAHPVDVVHLHWLEFVAPSDRTPAIGAAKTARRALRLLRTLRTLRQGGVAVVWTIHNLAPHEPAHPRIEDGLARGVLTLADRAIVHSEHARKMVIERFGGAAKLAVIGHGNYIGVYPPPEEDAISLRRRLGIAPGAFVYLAFGQVRGYKRLPNLLEAFRTLPDSDAELLVAGEPKDADVADRLRALAQTDRRIHLDLRRVPVDQVAAIHSVADAAVFPYADMFSSGSALLALSLGLPIVVPKHSTGSEIGLAPAVLAAAPDDLVTALNAIRAGDQGERRAAAIRSAARYRWDDIGAGTRQVYESACRERQDRSGARRSGA